MVKSVVSDMSGVYSDKYTVEIESGGRTEKVECLKAYVRQRKVSHLDRMMGRSFFDAIKQMSFGVIENSFSSPLVLKVTPNFEFKNYVIRPFRGNSKRNGDTIEVELSAPTKISLEFDGDIYENLFIFAESFDKNEFEPNDESVICFSKGIHEIGEIMLTDGQTLYLESGAFVYGSIIAENAKNIKICGHGIICGERYNHNPKLPRIDEIRFNNCENVTVDGITVIDSPRWTICLDACKNVSVNNVKEICNAFNSDGVDITACEDVVVTNCFFRGFDDSVSVKARHEKSRGLIENPNPVDLKNACYFGDVRNVLIKDCVFWPDAAHPMLVGPEAEPSAESVFENILFQNIIVLQHREFSEVYQGVMAIFCADNATIRNITFKDIHVDRMDCGRLISVIYTTEYASMVGKHVENILFENITYNGEQIYTNRIQGRDENHTIDDVVIKNMVILNKKQKDKNDLFGETPFVNDVKFE